VNHPSPAGEAYERKVLRAYLDPEGRLRRFPARQKKLRVILRHVAEAFEPGRRYTEREVKEILLRFNEDTARLRRDLVDFRLMGREGGGGDYWRPDDRSGPGDPQQGQ
jgi:hypothetical protein